MVLGCVGTDFIHNPADVGIYLHQRIRVVTEMRLGPELKRCIGWIAHLTPRADGRTASRNLGACQIEGVSDLVVETERNLQLSR